MRLFYPLAALVLLSVAAGSSCSSDNLEDLSGTSINVPCDTTAVATYSGVIRPLIERNHCLECHTTTPGKNEGFIASGFNYETATGLQNANRAGKLLPAIEHTGPFKMPKRLPKMADCEIARVKQWIRRGAPND